MKKISVEYRQVNDLIPYENNPRKNDDAVRYVANSIEEFGFKVPIVVDSEGVIVAGHTRLKAAKLLNLDEVPVIVADDLSKEQVKAFRLADNKVGELSFWDLGKLELEIEDLTINTDNLEIDLPDLGFSDISYIDDLLDNDLMVHDYSPEQFAVTIYFPIDEKESVESFIKEHGKDVVSNMVLEGMESYA